MPVKHPYYVASLLQDHVDTGLKMYKCEPVNWCGQNELIKRQREIIWRQKWSIGKGYEKFNEATRKSNDK